MTRIERVSEEQRSLLNKMLRGHEYTPDNTGFSIRTFEALEKRGMVTRVTYRTFKITGNGEANR